MLSVLLEQGENFYTIAARFALFPGHILINSRTHLPCIGALPPAHLIELEQVRLLVRRFLFDEYGKASFWENGASYQHVPHMHLHGWPVQQELPPPAQLQTWQPVSGIADLPAWYAKNGPYHYLQGELGNYVMRPGMEVFKFSSPWLSRQSGNPLSPFGGIVRSGTEETTAALVAQWRAWRIRNEE
jgi:diadenosine tetraphosphate (Ap4A) HIT family hydrolase